MAKITRKTQKVFGGSLTASTNIAQYGSLAAAAPAYSLDPDLIQTARYLNGWAGATVGNSSPAIQDRNAIDFLVTRQLANIFQTGVPEWDSGTTYYIGSVANDGNGVLYYSITDTNLGNALSDTNKWALVINKKTTSRAWAFINGEGSGSHYDWFNVASLTKLGVGNYLITFETPLPFVAYGFNLTCNQDGDNTGALQICTRFVGDIKTTTQFQFRVLRASTSDHHDVSEICVEIFSSF